MIRFKQAFLAIGIMLLNCSTTWCATLVVSSLGNGSFMIAGSGLDQVRGIDITLAYDNTVLSSPVVAWGNLVSGAINVANTGVPGSLKLAVVSITPLANSGQVANISFTSSTGNGRVTSIMARLINASGADIPVSAAITVSQQDIDAVADTSSSNAPHIATDSQLQGSSSPSPSTSIILGVVSMPTDSQPKSEAKLTDQAANITRSEPSAVPDETVTRQREDAEKKPISTEKARELKQINYVSVLERFKLYQGDRTPATMMALFDKQATPGLLQEPAIAVSDGSTGVKIYANLAKDAGSSPNFSLSDVKLISLERNEDTGTLVLKVLPKKNSINALITIMTDQTITALPLTLIPQPVEVTTKEAVFATFLKDWGAQKPKFDLNADGVHDYLDDYIYTGQYLINKAMEANRGMK